MKIENLISKHKWSTEHIILKGVVYDTVDFLVNAVEAGTIQPLANYYGVHYHTITRVIETQLPEIPGSGRLDNRILSVLGLKRCPKCKGFQTLSVFNYCEDCRKPKKVVPCILDDHKNHIEEVPWCEPCVQKYARWTRAEQDLLKKHYNIASKAELAELLPRFSPKQIESQVYRLRKCGWTFASKKP